uniref:Tetraspanin n=1 Tax=Dendroctonus ponderosae TaxID=77166 RepID=A0AAR5PK21_DENPD
MSGISLVGSKVILAVANFLLLACGFTLMFGGMLVIFDADRILLSKLLVAGPLTNLPQPLFYYVAVGLTLLGLTLTAAGILGCWASCLHSYWLISLYFVLIMAVLIGECTVYAITWIWPQCLVLGLDTEELVKTVQRNYGSTGEDQLTAAVDLVQTSFNCCGINSANEYDTSLWRLQGRSPPFAIPLTCCVLKNLQDDRSYLNLLPINVLRCQALEKNRHEGYRHTTGCEARLDQWYRQHYLGFLAIGLAVVLVEFIVLLSTILTCTRIYHHNQETKENDQNSAQIEGKVQYRGTNSCSNETYAMTESFRQNYKLLTR